MAKVHELQTAFSAADAVAKADAAAKAAADAKAAASEAQAQTDELAYAEGVHAFPKGVLDLTGPGPVLLTSDGKTVETTPLQTTDAEVPAVAPPVEPPVVTG